ncbi:MAG: D-alanine--D-alanine ligase [bacterium]|nr:D-alanine--D-alanine ligase [bacterium]
MNTQESTPSVNILLLFGGKSAEHDVSIISARNVFRLMDRQRFSPICGYIDLLGRWWQVNEPSPELKNRNFVSSERLAILPGEGTLSLVTAAGNGHAINIDAVFPVTHGSYGEDGTLQGLLRSIPLPWVGPDVLSSAICMDKIATKRILQSAGIPSARFVEFLRDENILNTESLAMSKSLSYPLFVKPANTGSSIGITKVNSPEGLTAAIETALLYDNRVLVEEGICGKEVECAVLGNNGNIQASDIGEVSAPDGFYSYEEKYTAQSKTSIKIPIAASPEVVQSLKETAVKAFKALGCEGLARVDMFLLENNNILINEVNTLPGFTNISMYPALWEHTGLSYSNLITKLIDLAFARHERDAKLKTSPDENIKLSA